MGLHFGWAIEGSLGTEYKIDASYVSPTVSVAENVERAADAYGASVIVTEATHSILSPMMSRNLRLIDRVKIQGHPADMNLYTVDLHYEELAVDKALEFPPGWKWNPRQRFRARASLEQEKKTLMMYTNIADAFDQHPDLQKMRQPYCEEFREIFGMAYQNYSQGEWLSAQRLLRRATTALGFEDGPSYALLRYIQNQHDCEPPSWWKGWHPLEEITRVRDTHGSYSGGGRRPRTATVHQGSRPSRISSN
jgi:hypothetical protein